MPDRGRDRKRPVRAPTMTGHRMKGDEVQMNYNTTWKKKTVVILLSVLAFCIGWAIGMCELAIDQLEGVDAWIICQPGDWVHARDRASTKSESLGMLVTGDRVKIDGHNRNGFMHVIDLRLEETEGWIYAGYLVTEEPVDMGGELHWIRANGRVACRKYLDGPRRCWVIDGSTVKVYYMGGGWAVTNKGFIQSEFIGEKVEGYGT